VKSWHQLCLNYQKGLVADHINKKRFDNRLENLRVVTPSQNCRNRSKFVTNTSGKQGVYNYINKKTKRSYWISRIVNDMGKTLNKCLSIQKLGTQEAKRQAIAWRLQKEQEYGYIGD
jgi:hypothetical protein